ncbi:MAG: AAA family ATPase, partial [Lentisphaeria bacterium]|nr:AAA family ATPase [Lentisphaeria bacterium]
PGRKLVKPASSFEWAECQKRAVDMVTRSPLSIITGGPGVGKTTVIREIVSRARLANLNIALTSPTGRAAKRMTEATGAEAKTIHRLLMYDPVTNGFIYGKDNRLECDILIADECSMLDINIAYSLFQAIAPGTTVVLVGDADQLPPVGPGKFFSDLIASGLIPVTRLDQVFRQSSGSRIIEAAHRVNAGKMPLRYDDSGCDFFWIRQDDQEKALDMVKKLVTERIPEKFGFDPSNEIQVLTPMNRGTCGAVNINDVLGECLNPPEEEKIISSGERRVAPGDKVMQTQNNYDKGVYNGDFGIVVSTDVANGKFKVLFDGTRQVEYFSDELDQLTRAYAITVHKSQGSEFPAVVLLLLNQHYLMLQRNLLYTAMTRAKKLLVLIGSEKSVEMAVRNARTEVRYTRFPRNLAEALQQ